MEQQARSLEAQYADAIQCEKAALKALQAQGAGTDANDLAWQAWSDAIRRTNLAWRQLSCYSLSITPHRPVANCGRAAGPGAHAASR